MRGIGRIGLVALGLLCGTGTTEARNNWGGGVYFGVMPPVHVVPYPSYPPPYYPRTPYYAAPAPAASEGCYAGPYVCPLEGPAQAGMPCSCPTTQGRAWGRAR